MDDVFWQVLIKSEGRVIDAMIILTPPGELPRVCVRLLNTKKSQGHTSLEIWAEPTQETK